MVKKKRKKETHFTNLRASSLHWEFFSPSAKISAPSWSLLRKVLLTRCSSVNTERGMQRAEEIVLYSETLRFKPLILQKRLDQTKLIFKKGHCSI